MSGSVSKVCGVCVFPMFLSVHSLCSLAGVCVFDIRSYTSKFWACNAELNKFCFRYKDEYPVVNAGIIILEVQAYK